MRRWVLWMAQGFGAGRCPVAPGSVGSLVGLGWMLLLAAPGRAWIYWLGAALAAVAAVPLCGLAEKWLSRVDPPSVVLDEIVALPWCFGGWIWITLQRTGRFPPVESFWWGRGLLGALAVWALFRFFDVLKPWPVRQSQVLPGGWGIVVDDLLAAVYVNGAVVLYWWLAGTRW